MESSVSGVRRLMPAFCEVTGDIGDTHERPVKRSSEVFRLGAKGQGFVVEVDFKLTFSFLAVEMEHCRHHFCSVELYLPGLEVSIYSCHVFGEHCLPVSAGMHDC